MKNRRSFLGAALAGVSGIVLSAADAHAQAPSSPPPSAPPQNVAKASAAALAAALAMRAFDPKLSDEEIAIIAKGIDDSRVGATLSPKKKRLKNSDEPVTRFAATERLA